VLQSVELREQVIAQLHSLENLVMFTLEMPAHTLKPWLEGMMANLISNFIDTPKNLSKLLISLDAEKCGIVCKAFFEVSYFHQSMSYFLQYLTSEQITIVLESLKDKLPDMIKSGWELYCVLQNLTSNQRTIVYELLIDKLPRIIKSGWELYCALQNLTSNQRTAVYELLKNQLPDMMKSSRDLHYALRLLTPEQRTAVLESLDTELALVIQSSSALGQVLCHYTPEKIKTVLQSNQLVYMIKSSDDWRGVLELLTSQQITVVIQFLSTDLIKSTQNLIDVLAYLTPEQTETVLESLNTKLIHMVQSSDELRVLLQYFAPEQITAKKSYLHTVFVRVIKSSHDFGNAALLLSVPQFNALYPYIEALMPADETDLIRHIPELINGLKLIAPHQKSAQNFVCAVLKGDVRAACAHVKKFKTNSRPVRQSGMPFVWKNKISEVLPHGSVAQLYKKILGNTPKPLANSLDHEPIQVGRALFG
jgi:hypothetical protein